MDSLIGKLNENGIETPCLCLDDLLATKEAARRPQDLPDIEFLRLKRSLANPAERRTTGGG